MTEEQKRDLGVGASTLRYRRFSRWPSKETGFPGLPFHRILSPSVAAKGYSSQCKG